MLGRLHFQLVRQHYEQNVVTFLATVCVAHIDHAPVFFSAGALMLRCIKVMGRDVFNMTIAHAGLPWPQSGRKAPREAALAAVASPLFPTVVPDYDQDRNWPYEVRQGARQELTRFALHLRYTHA